MILPLFAGLKTLAVGAVTFMTGSLFARLAGLVVFSTIGGGLFDTMVSEIKNNLQGVGSNAIFLVDLTGMDQAIGIILGAVGLKVALGMVTMRPSSAITGGS